MADGFIKLYRKLLDNPVFQNEKLFKLFIWCLLKSTYKDHEQLVGLQTVKLLPGQFVYGRIKASEELKIKESTVNKYMNWLQNNQIINIKSNNKFSVITILNWQLYQSEEENCNNKSNNNVTTIEQQRNTNKKVNKDNKDKKLKDIYIKIQHLTMTKEEYDKLISVYGETKVKDKLEYAENYSKLKNYNSLYLTLNNWLKTDKCKVIDHPYRKSGLDSNGNVFFEILKEEGKI